MKEKNYTHYCWIQQNESKKFKTNFIVINRNVDSKQKCEHIYKHNTSWARHHYTITRNEYTLNKRGKKMKKKGANIYQPCPCLWDTIVKEPIWNQWSKSTLGTKQQFK